MAHQGMIDHLDMPPEMVPAAPVNGKERIPTLDILRGVALFGILIVNIENFAGPESLHDIPIGVAQPAFVDWHAHIDLIILSVKWLFVEGKMRALFGMLFGAGAILFTRRIDQRGKPGRAAYVFLRRSMWLGLFGLVHGMLIWSGDILFEYSICALLFLMPLRHVRASRLLVTGAVVAMLVYTASIASFTNMAQTLHDSDQVAAAQAALAMGRAPTAEGRAALAAEQAASKAAPAAIQADVAEGHQGYLAFVQRNSVGFIAQTLFMVSHGVIADMLGAMLIGMGLYKVGFLSGDLRLRTYAFVALMGYAISLPLVGAGLWFVSENHYAVSSIYRWLYLPYAIAQTPAALANASVFLMILKFGWGRALLKPLGLIGRTAFSSYILTSILCQMLFQWGPWKLYGTLLYHQQLFVVAAVWAINLCASALWLRFFAFGPLEWVWRSLTYWRVQPFRRRRDARSISSASGLMHVIIAGD